jgi:hypothetical protein
MRARVGLLLNSRAGQGVSEASCTCKLAALLATYRLTAVALPTTAA